MSRLTNLLEYSCAGNAEKNRILKRPSFMQPFTDNEKQLLLGETKESTDLVAREIIGAVVEGAKSRECVRQVVPILNTKSNTARVVRATSPSGQYADYVAEGASIDIDTIRYSGMGIDTKKAAVRCAITSELIEDASFDAIELELKKAGAKLENKLNQQAITTMLDNVSGPADVDPTVTHMGLSDIATAKTRVDNYGWTADSIFLEPTTYAWLLDDTGIGDITSGGNRVIGLNAKILNAGTDKYATASWDGYDASNHYCGLVFDANNFAVIVMREDINFSQPIKDPIHDLVNIIAQIRFGVGVINRDAGCRILTK